MTELIFLQDLAVVMAASAAITIVCRKFRLPVVLGYILAGVIIGPHTPPYSLIKDLHSIHTLSELGVIFLLFTIGLEFSLPKLARVGMVSVFAATLEIALMIWIGFSFGRLMGWNFMNSLFLGAILSISSTTIIAKVLMETKKIKEKFAQVILGILIIEDLLAIVIIALLSGIAATGSLELREIGMATLRVFSFVGAVLLFGFLLVPRLLRYIVRFESAEMLIVTVLGLCFGTSLAAAKFGFSVALGAFLIGAVIAETKQAEEIVHKIEPIRDMFTAIFFVSVGLLLMPGVVVEYWKPIFAITLITILGKVASCSLGTFVSGYQPETAVKVGLGLAQIGEFSFIIARLGESTNVTSPFLYPVAVSVSGITTLTTPLLMRHSAAISHFLGRLVPRPFGTTARLYTSWFERDAKRIFHRALPILIAAGAGLLLVAAGSRFFPRGPFLAVVAVCGAAAVLFLWALAKSAHEKIEALVLEIIDKNDNEAPGGSAVKAHDELVRLIQEEYPGALETQDFLLPYQESAVNQPIRDLRLRSESGATIVAVYRGDEAIANPPPDTRLEPGDILLLMGDPGQVQNAVRYLNAKLREPAVTAPRKGEAKMEWFDLPAGSASVGKTLREIRLRRKTGVTVLGLQKRDLALNNPDPETFIECGDRLLLFGWPEQLSAAKAYLGS